MNILFFSCGLSNYVVDGLFYGLRQLEGVKTVDFPRMDYMYNDTDKYVLNRTGNTGITLYGHLNECIYSKKKRSFWQYDLDEYDLFIFNDVHLNFDIFIFLYNNKKYKNKIIVLDGNDETSVFPFKNILNRLSKTPYHFLYSFAKFNLFKRELSTPAELFGLKSTSLLNSILKFPNNIFPISMSIPSFYIKNINLDQKKKQFVNYNVDPDLNSLFTDYARLGIWKPTFDTTQKYLDELDISKFGITSKRAGWDCLRHYEYAARGVVLCFKDLGSKPNLSAPFGLNDSNSITYSSSFDLLNKLESINDNRYTTLQRKSYEWILDNSCENLAKRFLFKVSNIIK